MESHDIDEFLNLLLEEQRKGRPIDLYLGSAWKLFPKKSVLPKCLAKKQKTKCEEVEGESETESEPESETESETETETESEQVQSSKIAKLSPIKKISPSTITSESETLKNFIESLISEYNVSDIYNRSGKNKSMLNHTGKQVRKQIYDYIVMKKYTDENIDMALNLLKYRSIDFLLRLFEITSNPNKKKEKVNLIHQNIRKLTPESVVLQGLHTTRHSTPIHLLPQPFKFK